LDKNLFDLQVIQIVSNDVSGNIVPAKQLEVFGLFALMLIRVAEKDLVSVQVGGVFDAAHKIREERVGDRGDQDTYGQTTLSPETAGETVGLKV